MTPQDVYRIESEQINEAGLDAIVSISDHDSIDANLKLNEEIGQQNSADFAGMDSSVRIRIFPRRRA